MDSDPEWKSSIKEMAGAGVGVSVLTGFHVFAGKSFTISKNWLALGGTACLGQQGRR